jgi:hypothetical protein
MRNIAGYLILFCFIIIYSISLSESVTQKIFEYKSESTSFLKSDRFRYGDLFGRAYLPEFQLPISKTPTIKAGHCDTTKRSIDLYALCDSYIWLYLPADSFYCNVSNFQYATVNERQHLTLKLDTAKTNILLIELAESRVSLLLGDNFYHYILESINDTISRSRANSVSSGIVSSISRFLFNPEINVNLEYNIFESTVFTPFKKIKAAINKTWFDRMDDKVTISQDSKYLLYKPTTDKNAKESSFSKFSKVEIDTIVSRLNKIYDQKKALGFDEVYFTMIPNPVSILYPHFNDLEYNQLITRIQTSKELRIPVIDIYQDLKSSKKIVYHRSDTHWNIDGAFMWLNKFNLALQKLATNKRADH